MNDVFIPPFNVIDTHVIANGQVIDYWHNLLKVSEAHSTTKGKNAVIYILDTASSWTASDLSKDGNQYAFDATGQPADSGNHGHLCAGISAALNNEDGVLGVAPEALIIPVKGLHINSGSWDWIIKGLDYIKDNFVKNFKGKKVGIINMSFGGGSGYQPLYDKIKECVEVGLIPVAAAGNSGGPVNYPGAWDDLCITVPALDSNLNPASFTSYGPETDISAFGVSVISTAPNDTYPRVSGTSFSSPMIAGVCALIGDKHFNTFTKEYPKNKQIMEAHLKKLAKDLLQAGEDDKTGAGLAIIPPYLLNVPESPDGGNPPDDPGNDPEPPKDPKEERALRFVIDEQLFIDWNDSIANSMFPSTVVNAKPVANKRMYIDEMIVNVISTKFAEDEFKIVKDAITKFFRNRGLILLKGSDINDAAYWTVFFLEFNLKNLGLKVTVEEMQVSDKNKTKLKWS